MPTTSDRSQDAPPPQAVPRSINSEDRADLDAINRSIDRMRASTSTDPYILTIPQDVEPRYHHSYQYQAMQWLHQAPFQLKEGEMTQYQTFIYHEHGSDMYVLHNSRLREGAEGSAGKNRVGTGTGTGTPSGGPKKKITLDAYKRKNTPAGTPAQGTGTVIKGAPEVKQAPDVKRAPDVKHAEEVKHTQEVKRADLPAKKVAVKGPVERLKAQAEDLPELPMEVDTVPPAIEVAIETKELKRKRRNTEKEGDGLGTAVAASEEPVAKKARAGQSPTVVKEQHESTPSCPEVSVRSPARPETPPATSEETGLPPKLSPLEVPSLPSRLSPGIPANMIATLKAREQLRSSSSDGSAPSSSIPKKAKLSPPKRADGIGKHKSPAPRNGFKASSSSPAVRSDVEEKLRAPTSDARQRIHTPVLSKDDEVAVGKALKAKVKKNEKAPHPKDPETSQDDEADLSNAAKARKQEKISRAKVVEASQNDSAGADKVSKPKSGNKQSSEQNSVSEPPESSHGGTNVGARPGKTLPRREDEHGARKTVRSSKEDVPSLIVKLKYKKQQKEQIRRLLLLRPHPDDLSEPQTALAASPAFATKAAEDSKAEKPTIRRRDPNAKGVAQKVGPASNGVRKKVESSKIESKASASEKRPPPTESEARGATAKVQKLADTPMMVTTEASTKSTAGPVESKPATTQPIPARRAEAVQAAGTATTDISLKRKAASDATESPAKRKKVPDPIETAKEPSTPVQPNLVSPVALLSSAHRSQQATPTIRKDHAAVSVAMAREQSTTSNSNTPSAKLISTPITNGTSTSQPNGNSKPLASQLSNKTPKQQVWDDEQKRLETLGRDLKHAATDHLKANPVTDAGMILAAVKALESLLAYILAFSCADEAALTADPKQAPSIKCWRSMHGFFMFVRRSCKAFPLLMGITCQLGGVVNSRILEIMVQYPSERPATDIAVETYGHLVRNVHDGESRLDVDALQEHFPKSWQNRAKGALAADRPNVPADFAGRFKLPIGTQVPPLRAARAGYALLEEWMGKEGVEYELKLKL